MNITRITRRRVLCCIMLLVLAVIPVSYAEICPPCYYNLPRPNTTGNGTSNDGRPILTVQIDSSWNVNNAGQPQSSTNAAIWNGVAGCNGCVPPDGAAGMWNNAEAGGQKIHFNIQLNQNDSTPNIRIVRDDSLPAGACAGTIFQQLRTQS